MTAKSKIHNSLRAFADDKTAGITKGTNFRVDPNLIHIEPGFNLRQPSKDLDEDNERLFLAMQAGAFIPPVDVQILDGKITARDGHRRIACAKRLRKTEPEYTLECRQLPGNDADAVLHMLGTGTGGRPLSPLEAGIGYLRLVKMGQTPAQIAEKLGRSRPTIENGLTLAEAPSKVQKWIIDGDVSATLVREALKAEDPKAAIAALGEKVEALHQEEAEEKKKTPAKAKKGKAGSKAKKEKPAKKKKVTAKKLKGTPAEKKTGKKKKSKEAENANTTPPAVPVETVSPVIPDGHISVTLPRELAEEAVKRIRAFSSAHDSLKQVAATLETALI